MDVVIIPLDVFEFVHMLFTFCRLGCFLFFFWKGVGYSVWNDFNAAQWW